MASVFTSAATTASLAGLAGARRLYGGAERRLVGGRGEGRDCLHHRADPLGGVAQRADDALRPFRVRDCGLRRSEPVGGLLGDLLDGPRQFFGRHHRGVHAAGRFRRGLGGRRHPVERILGDLPQHRSASAKPELLDGFDHLMALATSNDMTCGTTLAPRSKSPRRKPMQARGHRVHRASVAGGSANTGITPDQRLLLDAVPARFGIVPIEIASEQSWK